MQSLDNVRRALEAVARELQRSSPKRGSTLRVASRTNVRVARNVGSPGSVTRAAAAQDAPIHQDGGT
jgi:hypothetical protein